MATVRGVNATKINNKEKVDVQDLGGRVRCSYDEYTLTADLSANDVIKMGRIPKGARLVDYYLDFDDLGTGGTLDVGYNGGDNGDETADPDGLIDGEDVNTAAGQRRAAKGDAALFKKFADNVDLEVTVATDTTATSGTIRLAAYYTFD